MVSRLILTHILSIKGGLAEDYLDSLLGYVISFILQ